MLMSDTAETEDEKPKYRLNGTRDGVPSLGVKSLSYMHDAIIDLIVANPWIRQNRIAEHFEISRAWLSVLLATDAFKARLRERRAELVDPTILATLQERNEAMLSRSMDIMQEKLSQDALKVSDNLVLKAIELGAKMRGEGGFAAAPEYTSTSRLNVLAERLIKLQSDIRKGEPYEEVEIREVRESASESAGANVQRSGLDEGQSDATAVRANGVVGDPAQAEDGGNGVDCSRCGHAVCQCDTDF